MMTCNDAVVMQQFCVFMTIKDTLPVCPPKMMDTVTTRAWEFSQTLNQIVLRGWLARLSVVILPPFSCLYTKFHFTSP